MAIVDVLAPEELEGTKSTVARWLKQPGEAILKDEPLVELETDKVSMEVFAPEAGALAEITLAAGEPAAPGARLGRVSTSPVAVATPPERNPEPSTTEAAAGPTPIARKVGSIADFPPDLRLSPSVRRLLMESGADPRAISGAGRGGRLTREDVRRHLAKGSETVAPPAAVSAAGASTIAHDTMRLRIAEHMVRSLTVAPHVTAIFEADFSAIIAHRSRAKAAFAAKGVSLTYTAYLVAASVQAMAAAPRVNSQWREDALELFSDVNVGVGTALGDRGLVVPVVHQAQTLSLFGIAQRLQDLTERARAGKLAPADLRGGTFSISNHGVSGSLLAAPIIINQPQSAILGVGKLEKRVVVREIDGADALAIRPMAFVSLSIDHRVLDGHQTNAWLSHFVHVLQTWVAED